MEYLKFIACEHWDSLYIDHVNFLRGLRKARYWYFSLVGSLKFKFDVAFFGVRC